MLSRLYIRNFALITETEIRLGPGLNMLTGETGAGKSLLLGALGLILGRRADFSLIFRPGQKCIVEAEFTTLSPATCAELRRMEAFDMEGDSLLLRREADTAGKSRAFINDTPVSLQTLKEATSRLVELTGQHEHTLLLNADTQLRLLDAYAGLQEPREAFGTGYRKLSELRSQLQELQQAEAQARMQADYFRFQAEELTAARLDAAEEADLEAELSLLTHAEELAAIAARSSAGLYEDEKSIYNLLSRVLTEVQKAARLSAEFQPAADQLAAARESLRETAYDLERLGSRIDLNPKRLQSVQERIDTYHRLQQKFGVKSVEALLTLQQEFTEKLQQFSSVSAQIQATETEIAAQHKSLEKLALSLEKGRAKAIPALCDAVNACLQDVGLSGARFSIDLSRTGESPDGLPLGGQTWRIGPAGTQSCTFRIRTNPGMPEGPLAAVASGGEISRVMLAIKAALAGKAELAVLIFDEIDTGISGETAIKVGRVMQRLAGQHQVIAITHLPQIAGRGQHHFLIEKVQDDGQTHSSVRLISGEDRVMALARMLSGENPTDSAVRNARELISSRD